MAWNPQTDVTGYYDAWRAEDLGLTEGASVASWASLTNGVALTATGGAQPTFRAAAVNGQPGVEFDGTSDYLRNSAGTSGLLTGVSGWTLYLVGSYDTSGNRTSLFITNSGSSTSARSNLRWMGGFADHQSRSSASDGSSFRITGSATEATSTVMVLCGTTDLANGDMWVYSDGTLRASNTSLTFGSSSTSSSPYRINFGSYGADTPGDFHDGLICEVWAFHAVHTATDRAHFHSYVQDKYGVTVADYVSSGTSASAAAAALTVTSNAATALTGTVASADVATLSVAADAASVTTSVSGSPTPITATASITSNAATATTTATASADVGALSFGAISAGTATTGELVAGGAGPQVDLYTVTGGAWDKPLPDFTDLALSPVFNDVGTVKFKYPKAGVNADVFEASDEVEVAVVIDNTEIGICRSVMEDRAADDISPDGFMEYSGRTTFALLERAIVWTPGVGESNVFANATAGTIMRTYLQRAQARGTLTDIDFSVFSNTTDSMGDAWTKQLSAEFAVGMDLLGLLKNLQDFGLCESAMAGRQLFLYNPGSRSIDRTTGAAPVVFRFGQTLREAPRKRSTRSVASVMLAAGADGVYADTSDDTALAARGRRETYLSQGSVNDPGTLLAYAQTQLARLTSPKTEVSHGLVYDGSGPQPPADFDLGDWVYSDTTGSLERLRVKQWTVEQQGDGTWQGAVVLNDLIAELDEELVRRLDAIEGGSTVLGNSVVSDVPPELVDAIAPAVPTGLAGTSLAYVDSFGVTEAQMTATWNAVSTNSDGTAINDLDSYTFRWKYGTDATAWRELTTSSTTVFFSNLIPNAAVNMQVRAKDKYGNYSAFSGTVTVTSASDATAPPVPSTPAVTAPLGTLRIAWNGLGSVGETMPADFWHTEVHVNTASGFTPSSVTLVDYLEGAGVSVVSGLPYDTPQYVKLISVDKALNKSSASASGTATPTRATGADIGAGSIGFDAIAFKDLGNLVEDGSFEDTARDALRHTENGTAFTYGSDGTAPHGTRYLRATASTASGTLRRLWLMDDMPIAGGEKYWVRFKCRRSVGSNGAIAVALNITNADASTTTLNASATVADATWATVSTVLTTPSTGRYFDIYARVGTDATAGTADFDMVEVRRVNPTDLIDDAAITNAKIANLAVDDAKMANVSVGKLTAGTLSADVTVSARIKTADSGARSEMNSTGFHVFNSSGTELFSATGSGVSMLGQVNSAVSGRRVIVNPDPVNYLSTIAFYPDSGTNFAYINTWIDSDGTLPGLGLNSGGDSTLSTAKQWTIRLQNDYYHVFRNAKDADNTSIGPSLYMDMARSDSTFNWVELESAPSSSSDKSFLRLMNQPGTGGVTVLGGAGNTFLTGSLFTSPGVNSTLFGNWVTFSNVGSGGAYTTISYGITHSRVPVPQLTPQADSGSAYMLGVTLRSRSSTGFGINTYPIRSADADQDWIVHWLAATTA